MNSGTVFAGNEGCTTDICKAAKASDGRNIADEVKIEFVIERRVDRSRRADKEERVAVGSGTHYSLGGDIGARARSAFNDDRLAEPLREPLPHQPRN